MYKVSVYQVVDHGITNSSYFRGCGVALTNFTDVATGIGNDFAEAFEDALDILAQNGWDTCNIEQEEGGSDIVDKYAEDTYYYVSIRVR